MTSFDVWVLQKKQGHSNGNPRKEKIAFAQSYFAVQIRKQEVIEERIAYIQRTEARGKFRESEKGYRKISMSVEWMMLDSDTFVLKVTRHYLVPFICCVIIYETDNIIWLTATGAI